MKTIHKLSIIIPAFNEERTIGDVIRQVVEETRKIGLEEELIVIDDASSDKTAEIARSVSGANLRVISQKFNQGKGAAVKRGFEESSGDVIIIQDADLEYNPRDYRALLTPIDEGRADVVFGTRFRGVEQRVLYFWHYFGNRFLTGLSNMLANVNLSDMETCYKTFRKEVVEKITPRLRSKRFGIEPELTARVAHGGWRIYEVPISYYGRTYTEGKKITWRDGINALFAIFWFNIFDK